MHRGKKRPMDLSQSLLRIGCKKNILKFFPSKGKTIVQLKSCSVMKSSGVTLYNPLIVRFDMLLGFTFLKTCQQWITLKSQPFKNWQNWPSFVSKQISKTGRMTSLFLPAVKGVVSCVTFGKCFLKQPTMIYKNISELLFYVPCSDLNMIDCFDIFSSPPYETACSNVVYNLIFDPLWLMTLLSFL